MEGQKGERREKGFAYYEGLGPGKKRRRTRRSRAEERLEGHGALTQRPVINIRPR